MKTKLLITLLLMTGLLAACSEIKPHSMDLDLAVQHEALVKHYEETAKEMQAKVQEHKMFLSQYEAKSYLYGRQAEGFKEHCQALINAYEKAAEENLMMANLHRQKE
ncbi:hypothetical protein NP603_21445 [Methylomonas sp. SURF-1]|uniref:DUF4398 domain-containing protein n=2 Tax=Methylomonas TaxID=416 RepID=A0ABU4UDX5_9GAMM|nr:MULTISPECIES: hypothetical protein [unclassified Methylomonas]MCQ8183686.1 hypothetical protein [Methylomonas sp. SURF-1]MDX8126944.1 hypothetical protein [Methylomonas sp. OY6]